MELTIHPRAVAVAQQLAAERGPDYAAAWLADLIQPALASALVYGSQRAANERHRLAQATRPLGELLDEDERPAPDIGATLAAAMSEIEKETGQ